MRDGKELRDFGHIFEHILGRNQTLGFLGDSLADQMVGAVACSWQNSGHEIHADIWYRSRTRSILGKLRTDQYEEVLDNDTFSSSSIRYTKMHNPTPDARDTKALLWSTLYIHGAHQDMSPMIETLSGIYWSIYSRLD